MKTIGTILITLFLVCNLTIAQDTLYVYKTGSVISKRAVIDIDSVTFSRNYKTNNPETATDIDGNAYHTVKIGAQTWMVENLRTTKYRNGESIPNVSADDSWNNLLSGAWCDLGNNTEFASKYGHLYNGYAVSDNRNIAPTGWHVPTNAEWTTLENYLIANGYNYDGTKVNSKISKSLVSNNSWFNSSVIGAIGNDLSKNNSSGFNALPAGYRDPNISTGGIGNPNYTNFVGMSYISRFWTSTIIQDITPYLYFRSLGYKETSITSPSIAKGYGFSVRCIKD